MTFDSYSLINKKVRLVDQKEMLQMHIPDE
jgi:hypothetical protein